MTKHADEQIGADGRTRVAYVRDVVGRRAAAVDPRLAGLLRDEGLDSARERVVQADRREIVGHGIASI
jgi:hypothetical protein